MATQMQNHHLCIGVTIFKTTNTKRNVQEASEWPGVWFWGWQINLRHQASNIEGIRWETEAGSLDNMCMAKIFNSGFVGLNFAAEWSYLLNFLSINKPLSLCNWVAHVMLILCLFIHD